MGYEFRTFDSLQSLPKQQSQLLDIYVHKQGTINMSVKVRNPQQKQYGWKMSCFQCKICITPKQVLQKTPQKWYKFILKCDKKIKLIQISQQEKKHKTKKINNKISEVLINNIEQIQKSIQQKELSVQNLIKEWCQKDIDEMYVIKKNKNKMGGVQQGILSIEPILQDKNQYYFETQAQEHKNTNKYKSISKKANTSYPQLLDQIWKKSKKI